MSYAMLPLGYDVEVETPFGTQTVSFDLDKVSQDVSAAMIEKSWPIAELRLQQSMPGFVDRAAVEAQPHVDEALQRFTKTGFLLVGVLGLSLLAVSWYHKQPATRRRLAAA